MNQIIFATALAVILGIASGFPVFTCNKLKDVKEGVDNHDQYLIKLKDADSYVDAEYLIDFVKRYQTNLDLYAFNVHEPSVKSQLELSENAGVLHGTLSKQVLVLVCLESTVEFIAPNYPEPIVLPEGSGDSNSFTNCPKLVVNEPYTGNDYSITFNSKTSSGTLYHLITKIELAERYDNAINFKYYYSIRKGEHFFMVVKLNTKALEMVCKEAQVKEIKPNHDVSIINKRDATTESDQDVKTTGHCDLPEHSQEFPNIIVQYKEGADLDAIKEAVEQNTENSAEVKSAIVLPFLDTIIFQMNRAAYLQACTNLDITLVEYEQVIEPIGHCGLPEHTEEFPKYIFVYKNGANLDEIKKTVEGYTENSAQVKSAITLDFLGMIIFQMNRAAYLQACTDPEIQSVEYDQETGIAQKEEPENANICEQVDSLQDSHDTYTAVIKKPDTVEGRQNRCLKLITKLQNKAKKSDGKFWIFANSNSCKTEGEEVTLTVRLNLEALKHTCGLKGLEVSVLKPSTGVGPA